MGDHSILAPSSAHVWGHPEGCPGSVLMAQIYPDTDESQDSKDGVAAHWVAADMVVNAAVGVFDKKYIGVDCPENGVTIDVEMENAARIYGDDVGRIMRETGCFVPKVEQRVDISILNHLMFGTPDLWLFDKKTKHLYIWDFKFGRLLIEVFENWQMICYVAGILETIDVIDEYVTVHFRVVQPRGFHRDGDVREWVIKASKLRGYFNMIESKAVESLRQGASFSSGTHCYNCNGRHVCPAALRSGAMLYEVATKPLPLDIPTDAMGVQLSIVERALEQLKCIRSGLSEQVEMTIRRGTLVPGWGLTPVSGRQKWSKTPDEIVIMGDAMGIDLRKNETKTPKQAIALGADEKTVNSCSHFPRSGVKLTPDNGNKAKNLFNAPI